MIERHVIVIVATVHGTYRRLAQWRTDGDEPVLIPECAATEVDELLARSAVSRLAKHLHSKHPAEAKA
jgi:hypothetical protein